MKRAAANPRPIAIARIRIVKLEGVVDAVHAGHGKVRVNEPVQCIDRHVTAIGDAPGDAVTADHFGVRHQAKDQEIDVLTKGAKDEWGGEENSEADFGAVQPVVRPRDAKGEKPIKRKRQYE